MELKSGYRLTEAGVLPEEWEVSSVGAEFSIQLGKMLDSGKNVGIPKPFLGNRAIQWGRVDLADIGQVKLSPADLSRFRLREGDLLVCEGGEIGRAAIWRQPIDECYYQKALHRLRPKHGYNAGFMLHVLEHFASTGRLLQFVTQTSIAHLPKDKFEVVPIPLPESSEQERIADALNDADALTESLEQLIGKKRQIKQAAMQELLNGKKRLPGFSSPWATKLLGDVAECLDNLRVPLNDRQRANMQGPYPYCGANGVLDYINDFRVDDDVILMAEDGGYFDEYATRPIAYRMIGKSWVNNHAHILKARPGYDHGFLFYSLVHRNILRFLASGTRAKLNKSEMEKIEIEWPSDPNEAIAISSFLADIQAEISACDEKLLKIRMTRQGMMQELLTGRIRFVDAKPSLELELVQSG